MIAIVMNYAHKPGTNIDKYYRGRAILAGRHASKYGRWSQCWATALLKWHDHCRRGTDADMWHSAMLLHHDALWLAKQRLEHGRSFISRTRTRLKAGKVLCRWSECLELALEVAPAWNATTNIHFLTARQIFAAQLCD